MKCTNKWIAAAMICIFSAGMLTGCSGEKTQIKAAYDVYETSAEYGLTNESVSNMLEPFSKNICVIGFDNSDPSKVHAAVAEGAGLFNTVKRTVPYAQNIYEKLYPASTTKILTAYIALKYGDLNQKVTVSEELLKGLDASSSVCGLKAGDTLTLEQLLYGLMLCSGNDAAVTIAETISGSIDDFADLMNKEAQALGATHSHFVNPHGLPDEDHYTTVYDLYLIFNAAISDERFTSIINSASYQATYTDASGNTVTQTWKNTNKYLNGEVKTPDGITVIGGKTGTTRDAGYCLVLLSENNAKEPVISIVLKADGRSDLYLLMSDMLSNFSN